MFWWRRSLNFELCIEFRAWSAATEEENIARTGASLEALAELFNHLIRAPALIRSSNNSSVSLFCIPLGKSYTSRIWLTSGNEKKKREMTLTNVVFSYWSGFSLAFYRVIYFVQKPWIWGGGGKKTKLNYCQFSIKKYIWRPKHRRGSLSPSCCYKELMAKCCLTDEFFGSRLETSILLNH